MNLEKKIEQVVKKELNIEELKSKFFMCKNFIDGLVKGEFIETTEQEILEIIDKNFFSFESLNPLNKEQENSLRVYIFRRLNYFLNVFLKKYSNSEICFDGEFLYLSKLGSLDKKKNLDPLSVEEKIKFFFDPNFLLKTGLYDLSEKGIPATHSSLGFYGERNLIDNLEGYFESSEIFLDILKKVREKTGKEKLTVLDVGCGMGKALSQIKEIDPNTETHGVTLEQTTGLFNVDEFHFIAAENMPKSFKNKFDLILSNMSFMYYLYPNIALRNVLCSLSKGGCADIVFMYNHNDIDNFTNDPYRDIHKIRLMVEKEFEIIYKLQKEGKLKIKESSYFHDNGMKGRIFFEKLEEFDYPED